MAHGYFLNKFVLVKNQVIINPSFAIAPTAALTAQSLSNHKIVMELEAGTGVKGMLLKLSSIGSPEQWDELMLNVFVNHKIAPFDRPLRDNDIIDLHRPVSGGWPTSVFRATLDWMAYRLKKMLCPPELCLRSFDPLNIVRFTFAANAMN